MEEDIKKMEDEAINLIGCDTIVNSPSLNLLSPLNRLFSESSFHISKISISYVSIQELYSEKRKSSLLYYWERQNYKYCWLYLLFYYTKASLFSCIYQFYYFFNILICQLMHIPDLEVRAKNVVEGHGKEYQK